MAKAFEIRQVVKQFRDFQLGPIDLSLAPGRVLAYIGPNGSGKTTTHHCLAGLLRADRGEIQIFGRPGDPRRSDWKRDIGVVSDVHVFYERWTAAQNLAYLSRFYPGWSGNTVRHLADRFQLPMDKKVKTLSTGNRVKLSLIAALAPGPKLLLLDEPTSGLDPIVRAEVLDVLFDMLKDEQRAIFYSTHILSDISRLADELAFLVDGRILRTAVKEDLFDNWRRVTFRLSKEHEAIEGAVSHHKEGADHLLLSSDGRATVQQLRRLGAENIQETRMTLEEIAIQILKGGRDVALD
jgi:ABC-2 type transport system ATP-binding protein